MNRPIEEKVGSSVEPPPRKKMKIIFVRDRYEAQGEEAEDYEPWRKM